MPVQELLLSSGVGLYALGDETDRPSSMSFLVSPFNVVCQFTHGHERVELRECAPDEQHPWIYCREIVQGNSQYYHLR